MTTMVTGQVKWFNMKAGFGFITVCDHSDFGELAGKDIFVHFSAINVEQSQYKYLIQGEYVDFHVVKSENEKHELQATNVRGVYNGPIMCETKKEVRKPEIATELTTPVNETSVSASVSPSNDGFITKTRKRSVPKKNQVKPSNTKTVPSPSVQENVFIPSGVLI